MSDAYLAGVFEGEGWVHVSRGKVFYTQACVKMTCEDVVCLFQDRWAGSIQYSVPANENHSPTWKWSVVSLQAAQALEDMLPWLIAKKQIAEIGIQAARIRRTAGNKGCTKKLSEDELEARRIVAERAHDVNRRGRK